MNIEVSRTNIPLCRSVAEISCSLKVENDVIVPDSLPDILTVLQVSANANINSCEPQSDRVLISGTSDFSVIYFSDASRVCPIRLSVPFSQLCEKQGITPQSSVRARVSVRKCGFELINCRKLSVWAELMFNVSVTAESDVEIVESLSGCETKSSEITASKTVASARKEVPIEETLEIPRSKPRPVELLRTTARISSSDMKVIANKAIIRGDITVGLLYNSESGVDFSSQDISFSEIIDAQGLSDDSDAEYYVSIANINAYLDDETVNFDAVLIFEVEGYEAVTVNAVTDAFLPRGALETEHAALNYSAAASGDCDEHFIKETISLPQAVPRIAAIYDVNVTPVITSAASDGLTVKIEGFLDTSILYMTDDENLPVYSFNTAVDFSHEFDSSECNTLPDADATVKSVSYALTSNDQVELRAQIVICTRCTAANAVDVVTGASEAPYSPPPRASVIVYFVKEGDTLWDLAKKYNVRLSDIFAANALDEDAVLNIGMPLIIPR